MRWGVSADGLLESRGQRRGSRVRNPFDRIKGEKRRYIEGFLLALAMIGLSFFFVYLLRLFEAYFNAEQETLQRFAPLVYVAVVIIALLNNATIVIPAPGIAIIIALATQFNPAIVAVSASIGGTLGELTGYYAGRVGNRIVAADQIKGYEFAKRRLERHGYWIISFFAFVPVVLFDIVGLVAGGLKIPVGKFILATWVGRIPRSFVEVFGGATILHLVFPQWFQ